MPLAFGFRTRCRTAACCLPREAVVALRAATAIAACRSRRKAAIAARTGPRSSAVGDIVRAERS